MNFYHRFIIHYFKIVALLSDLFKGTKNNKKLNPFKFLKKIKEIFEKLKKMFIPCVTEYPGLVRFPNSEVFLAFYKVACI